jgi:DNA-binding SARP family transcriptional activator
MVDIYVSQLRKVIPREMLRTSPPGYVLQTSAEAIDVARFARLRSEGRAAASAGDAATAAERFAQALTLWRGPALAEFAEDFARSEAAHLEEARLVCLEDRIDADLALGRHADLVGELDALVARWPERGRLRGQLMLALYRAGRHGDALTSYRAFRERLDSELGLVPSAELRELERRIVVQDPSLDLAPAAAPRPRAPAGPIRSSGANLSWRSCSACWRTCATAAGGSSRLPASRASARRAWRPSLPPPRPRADCGS